MSYRSKFLYIPTLIGSNAEPGHTVKIKQVGDHFSLTLDYVLRSYIVPKDAKSVAADTLWFYDLTPKDSKTDLPKQVNVEYKDQEVSTTNALTCKENSLVVIVKSEDDYAGHYRDHENKRILPKNIVSHTYRYNMFYDSAPGYSTGMTAMGMNATDDRFMQRHVSSV